MFLLRGEKERSACLRWTFFASFAITVRLKFEQVFEVKPPSVVCAEAEASRASMRAGL